MLDVLLNLLLGKRIKELERLRELYSNQQNPDEIAVIQLRRFNQSWGKAWQTIPFYQKWRKDHKLPEVIQSLNQLDEFPVLTKDIIAEQSDLIALSPSKKRYTRTGGTSGLSVAFPMGKNDADSAWVNTHLGRSWNGVKPRDPLFMIWGHSHLFSGRGAVLKQLVRRIKDYLSNIERVSAYNLSEAHLKESAHRIVRFQPKFLIGYGSCLVSLCNYLEASDYDLAGVKPTCVVNTSETLSEVDAALVSKVFASPVVNEYGMAEAGVVGYSCKEIYPIRVFWNDFILRMRSRRLMLTTLEPHCFPLINYDTEDLCDEETPESGSILFLSNLLGKARDRFDVTDLHGDKKEVSVILFDHILKQNRQFLSLHYELDGEGRVRICYTSAEVKVNTQLAMALFIKGMRHAGIEIDESLVEFSPATKILQTEAGKRQALIRKGLS